MRRAQGLGQQILRGQYRLVRELVEPRRPLRAAKVSYVLAGPKDVGVVPGAHELEGRRPQHGLHLRQIREDPQPTGPAAAGGGCSCRRGGGVGGGGRGGRSYDRQREHRRIGERGGGRGGGRSGAASRRREPAQEDLTSRRRGRETAGGGRGRGRRLLPGEASRLPLPLVRAQHLLAAAAFLGRRPGRRHLSQGSRLRGAVQRRVEHVAAAEPVARRLGEWHGARLLELQPPRDGERARAIAAAGHNEDGHGVGRRGRVAHTAEGRVEEDEGLIPLVLLAAMMRKRVDPERRALGGSGRSRVERHHPAQRRHPNGCAHRHANRLTQLKRVATVGERQRHIKLRQ